MPLTARPDALSYVHAYMWHAECLGGAMLEAEDIGYVADARDLI